MKLEGEKDGIINEECYCTLGKKYDGAVRRFVLHFTCLLGAGVTEKVTAEQRLGGHFIPDLEGLAVWCWQQHQCPTWQRVGGGLRAQRPSASMGEAHSVGLTTVRTCTFPEANRKHLGFYASHSLSTGFQICLWTDEGVLPPILHRTPSCSGCFPYHVLELSLASVPTFQNLPNYGSLKLRFSSMWHVLQIFSTQP